MVEVWAWVAVASTLAYLLIAARQATKNRQALEAVPKMPSFGEVDEMSLANGGMTPTFALLWRATWSQVLLRSVLLVLLGLTPLGATLVRAIAPAGDTVRSFAACVLIVLIVSCPGLLTWRLRASARVLSPELRRRIGKREWIRWWLGLTLVVCIGAWTLCSDLTVFFASCVSAVVTLAVLLLLDQPTVREVTSSPAVTATLNSLPYPTQPGLRIVEGYSGKARSETLVDTCAVSDSKYAPVHIVVSPRTVAVLSSRELTAVIGHETAHVERRDLTVTRRRKVVVVVAVVASGVGSTALAGLRALADAPVTLGAESLPLMLVSGYAVFRLLQAIALWLSRDTERCCDVRMLALSQDREAAVAAVTVLLQHLYTPESWTRAQQLLMATHPAKAERLWILAHTPIPAPATTKGLS